MGNGINNNTPSSYQQNLPAPEPPECSILSYKMVCLLQTYLINFYLLSLRIFVTKAGAGTKDASVAPNAITPWWKNLLLPRMSACCARSAIPASAPPSAFTARRPSCLVSSKQNRSSLELKGQCFEFSPNMGRLSELSVLCFLQKTCFLLSLHLIQCTLEIKRLFFLS